MTGWEKKILDTFISHYFSSLSELGENRSSLRIRSSSFYPDFDSAPTNEKESYLEAAESFERKGLLYLRWEKRGKGEHLKTLNCENFELLFEIAGKPYPKTEAEKIRAILAAKSQAIKRDTATEKVFSFLEFYSLHFGLREIGQGIDKQTMEEIIRFLEFSSEPAHLEKITTRALSILLYKDSKRLEKLLSLNNTLFARMKKTFSSPDPKSPLADESWETPIIPERSYPETLISGKIIFKYKKSKTPMINAGGFILGFPLESIVEIATIQPATPKKEKAVLTIENKETFYALGSPNKHNTNYNSDNISRFDCFLYTGGYPNRAAAAIIKILAASEFTFYHAGDLDPDGVLILQNILDIAGKPVTPVRMDADTFDKYRTWARPLGKATLRQINKIKEETRAISCLDELLRRIEETSLAVEQEIIDYR
ncbi:MAG: DUF2220 domain-containing protein [Treponema sp.]|jgi:hypothetical protein|nr:DUF2220 domain-containing protein [Treponema sp.]